MSVARALYRHELCDVYLLDDPFAAVDMTVGAHIFKHAVQDLLKGKTRIMALSSHLHLLQHFDTIIVMEQGQGAAEGAAPAAAGAAAAGNGTLHTRNGTGTSGPSLSAGPAADVQGSGSSTPSSSQVRMVMPKSKPDDAHSQLEQGAGARIVAMGSFNELKVKYSALMSQRDPTADGVDEDGEDAADGADDDEEAVQVPLESAELPSLDYPSALPISTPIADDEHKDVSGRARVRTTSGATSRNRRLKTRHSSRSRSRSQRECDEEVVAQQVAAAKKEELMKNAPKSGLIEKEARGQGSVSWDVWVRTAAAANSFFFFFLPYFSFLPALRCFATASFARMTIDIFG